MLVTFCKKKKALITGECCFSISFKFVVEKGYEVAGTTLS